MSAATSPSGTVQSRLNHLLTGLDSIAEVAERPAES